MQRILMPLVLLALVAWACSGTSEPAGDVHDGNWWTGGDHGQGEDDGQASDSLLGDGCGSTQCADVALDTAQDSGLKPPVNTPPELAKLSPVSLDQGKGTTLDLNPFMSDLQDADSVLTVAWHAKEVALQDPGDHVLYIVAPTTWAGAEVIPLEVTDSGGLVAVGELKVIVQEVDVPEPRPPVECPKTEFTLDAGKNAKEVLLSGNFNNWGADNKTAAVMTDPDTNGIFEVMVELAPGTYQYKFIVDGNWITDPENPDRVDDGYGGKNSLVTVPECEE